jgi:hypothetical protein
VAKDGITTAISEPTPKAVAETSAIKATGKRIIKDDPASRGIAAIVDIFLIAFLLSQREAGQEFQADIQETRGKMILFQSPLDCEGTVERAL